MLETGGFSDRSILPVRDENEEKEDADSIGCHLQKKKRSFGRCVSHAARAYARCPFRSPRRAARPTSSRSRPRQHSDRSGCRSPSCVTRSAACWSARRSRRRSRTRSRAPRGRGVHREIDRQRLDSLAGIVAGQLAVLRVDVAGAEALLAERAAEAADALEAAVVDQDDDELAGLPGSR